MQWFSSVNDAICILKLANDIILVVSVEEKPDDVGLRNRLETALKNSGNESKFVGLNVPVSSELYKQLCAIYNVVPAPCLFFIRGDGQPIDIIENISLEEIQLRIADIEKRGQILPNTSHLQKTQDGSGDKDAIEAGVQNEDSKQESRGETAQGSTSSEGDDENGQFVCRDNPLDGEGFDHSDSSWPPTGSNSEQPTTFAFGRSALIHFRLPSGEAYTHEFPVNTTIRDLYDYVGQNIALPFNYWTLALVFPRRDLDINGESETVADLALVPNGVVLIVPIQEPEPDFYHDASSFISTIFTRPWSVMYSIWSYLYSYIFPATESEENLLPDAQVIERPQQNANQFPSSRRQPHVPTPNVTRDGNVHRLRFGRNDDDDNNTWNGNSTQQM